ncbi:hypothetical protein GCM10023206_00940 [Acinetobacter puyangensis]
MIRQYQKGVGLLEALVAVLLSSIVILGAAYSTGRILANQKQTNMQYIVINELRTKLQTATTAEKKDWCDGTGIPTITLPGESTTQNITVTCASVNVTVNSTASNNKTIAMTQPIKFEIESALLGGKLTVGETL